jgi:hypothetical protein
MAASEGGDERLGFWANVVMVTSLMVTSWRIMAATGELATALSHMHIFIKG